MTTLWIAVVAMLLLALLLLVPPFFRRQDAPSASSAQTVQAFYRSQLSELTQDVDNAALGPREHKEAVDDVTRGLLQDMDARKPRGGRLGSQRLNLAVAAVLSLGLPVAAVLLYEHLGNPRAVAATVLSAQQAEPHDASDDEMGMAINALAQRLRTNPDDVEGWYMLARSYETLGRFNDAIVAYENTLRVLPDEPGLLADYADALLSANDGETTPKADAALEHALKLNPDQPKALALAGMIALRRGDAALAQTHWLRLKSLLPEGSEVARQIDGNLALARATAAASPTSQPTAATPGPAVAAIGAAPPTSTGRITGTARIADALRAQVNDDDTVFILARAASGKGMPFAILKRRVKDLPLQFVLDDSTAMSPSAKLSQASTAQLEVRVSRSGMAGAQAGDLLGVKPDVPVGAEKVDVLVDTVVK